MKGTSVAAPFHSSLAHEVLKAAFSEIGFFLAQRSVGEARRVGDQRLTRMLVCSYILAVLHLYPR